MPLAILAALFAAPAAAAAAPAAPPLATSGMAIDEAAYEDPALMLQGKVVGKPENCVASSFIRKTRIPSDKVVLFLVDERWMRSDLPQACPGLGPGSAIAEGSFADMICAGDPFGYTTSEGTGPGQVGCSFGPFSPYELPKNPAGN